MTRATPDTGRLTGTQVLSGVVGFFLLIVATDAWLVYKAVSTFGGIETTDAYRKGLAYNERLAAGSQQDARRWQEAIAFDRTTSELRVTLHDAGGQGISGLALTGMIGRAATNSFDRPVAFEQQGEGVYRARLDKLDQGSWVLALEATDGSIDNRKIVYRSKARLWNKP